MRLRQSKKDNWILETQNKRWTYPSYTKGFVFDKGRSLVKNSVNKGSINTPNHVL